MKKFFLIVLILIVTMSTTFAVALFNTPYIGNSNTMKFHYANCRSVDEMNPSNQVGINSREEAINAGYIPCKRCKP
mgnify:CR=1 FL=1